MHTDPMDHTTEKANFTVKTLQLLQLLQNFGNKTNLSQFATATVPPVAAQFFITMTRIPSVPFKKNTPPLNLHGIPMWQKIPVPTKPFSLNGGVFCMNGWDGIFGHIKTACYREAAIIC